MNIEDKLFYTRFNVDRENPHIKLNREVCEGCEDRVCLYICPAENYQLLGDEILFSWESCMECGTCRIVCSKGALSWDYPRGGFGVCFRYG